MKKYINKKSQILSIEADECPDNPIEEWETLGTYYTFESRHISPNNHNFNDALEFLGSIIGGELVEKLYDKNSNTKDFLDDVFKRANKLGYIMFPISRYEHGNVLYSLGTSSGWDCGTVGIAFATKKEICEWFNKKRISSKLIEQTKEIFESNLNTYTNWCNGDVYGFRILDQEGNEIDSCWGFYGLCLDTDLNEAKKSGLLDYVADCTDCGDPEDWKEAEIEYVVYKEKIA